MSPSSDPRLIKAQLDSIQSAIGDLRRDADGAIPEIEDPQVRRALVSLSSAVDLMNTLVVIALESYRRELEERIDPQI
uniref:Uncharacterized protein n=1 Tax=candidate division WWE3 bacterium TaxID=2053526 RepID=A0A831Z2S6_UNCKA